MAKKNKRYIAWSDELDIKLAQDAAAQKTEPEPAMGSGELLIPGEAENKADKTLADMASDSVRSYYTLINLAALIITSLVIALTLLLIREAERYSIDNIQLSAQTFLDGSYTESLSNRYMNELKLDNVISSLANAARYAYGFGGEMQITPVTPDIIDQTDDYWNYDTTTTTTDQYYEDMTTTGPSQSSAVSVNESFTGTPVTMPTVTISVEADFTGVIKHTTTTMTTSFTTVKPYSYTGTQKPSGTTTTAPSEQSTTTTTTAPSQTTTTTTSAPPAVTTTSETTTTTTTASVTETPTETPAETDAPPAADADADAAEAFA